MKVNAWTAREIRLDRLLMTDDLLHLYTRSDTVFILISSLTRCILRPKLILKHDFEDNMDIAST